MEIKINSTTTRRVWTRTHERINKKTRLANHLSRPASPNNTQCVQWSMTLTIVGLPGYHFINPGSGCYFLTWLFALSTMHRILD
ncbi:hypothetical protein Y032_0100g3242 [Ancylostoma ceylanicum]|uniref:Uncharacterized protein n=1 Tax=Ancylostoma ceylanicum TaxID=53326 RepID=A0A016TIC9_9BILA|nr:hypothetical protein Y032_0100g3242 [Ancylostoma ceylanicum]